MKETLPGGPGIPLPAPELAWAVPGEELTRRNCIWCREFLGIRYGLPVCAVRDCTYPGGPYPGWEDGYGN